MVTKRFSTNTAIRVLSTLSGVVGVAGLLLNNMGLLLSGLALAIIMFLFAVKVNGIEPLLPETEQVIEEVIYVEDEDPYEDEPGYRETQGPVDVELDISEELLDEEEEPYKEEEPNAIE